MIYVLFCFLFLVFAAICCFMIWILSDDDYIRKAEEKLMEERLKKFNENIRKAKEDTHDL